MQQKNKFVVGFIAAAILGTGCASSYEIEQFDYKAEYDRVSKTSVVAKKMDAERDISEIIKRKASYIYSAVGKRDPFRSYFGDFKALERERQIVHPLQNYDVSDISVTAITWGITEPRAVVISPEKKSYIVKRGSFIGKNWGKITNILPDKIEITEVYKDPLGRKILNKLYIELPIKTLVNEAAESDAPILEKEKGTPGKQPAAGAEE